MISQQLWEEEYFDLVSLIFLKIKPIKLESNWENGYLEDKLILSESPLFDAIAPKEDIPFYAISIGKNKTISVKRYDITRNDS